MLIFLFGVWGCERPLIRLPTKTSMPRMSIKLHANEPYGFKDS